MACFLLGLFHEKLKKVSIFEQNFTAKICGRRLLCKQQRIVAWCTKDPGVFFFFFYVIPSFVRLRFAYTPVFGSSSISFILPCLSFLSIVTDFWGHWRAIR